MLALCSQASPRVLGRGTHQPLPQAILLNVSGWFLPVHCLGQASTPAAACSINNSGRMRGGGPTHCLPQHLSSSLLCSSSSQAGPPSPAEHPVHPLPDRLHRPGLGGDAEQRAHGAAVRAALPGTRGLCLGCGECCRGSRTGRVSKQEPGPFPPLRALPCSRQEPAQPSLRLPPGHRHRWPDRQHAALWLPLRHAVPLPDAVPAELGTGLLERVEPGQELHHPRERWVRSHWGGPLCLARQHSRGGTATRITPLSSLATFLLLQPPRGSWMRGGVLGRPGQAGGWRCSCAGR